ncbi:hypothetical protein [Acetobacter persici]
MTGDGWTIIPNHSGFSMPSHPQQMQQHRKAHGAIDQDSDR